MRLVTIVFFCLLAIGINAQHTFSIVAVDTINGEVGGAGATCYSVVNDIADVHPGIGFIHTQSYVDYNNQQYAHNLMELGLLPQQIMDSLQLNDASGQPQLRQYAAVMLSNGPHAAAFTGTSCFTYYGERVGRNYAIAGNILLGAMVLDSMESRFLQTQGTLADKLIAALQGAKIIGADKRCLNKGVSSLSAYMIVAKPTDITPSYYINLNVENVLPMDPIDSLQNLYDHWQLTSGIMSPEMKQLSATGIYISPNPVYDNIIQVKSSRKMVKMFIYNSTGLLIMELEPYEFEMKINVNGLAAGFYMCRVTDISGKDYTKKFLKQ